MVPVSSWFNDPRDTELVDMVPFLVDLTQVDDIWGILDRLRAWVLVAHALALNYIRLGFFSPEYIYFFYRILP